VVAPVRHFAIDATFIAKKTHDTFLGAPLLTTSGQDSTFVFGFLRDLLRLRQRFAIRSGYVIVSRDSYAVGAPDLLPKVVASFEQLKIPYLHDPCNSALNLTYSAVPFINHAITADVSFLQLASKGMTIVLPRKGDDRDWDVLSAAGVEETIGIAAQYIPTYLALTDPLKGASLTNKQAVRLIASLGDLDNILRNQRQIVPSVARWRIADSKKALTILRNDKTCRQLGGVAGGSPVRSSFDRLNTGLNRRHLARWGIPSLSILLPAPSQSRCELEEKSPHRPLYYPVVDRAGLFQFKALILQS
jgi:hypothetical protein